MQQKFVIYSPPYQETIGGVIVMHKLCHLINEAGGSAYLYPWMPTFELHPWNLEDLPRFENTIRTALGNQSYRRNPALNTPVLKPSPSFKVDDNCCCVYPEVIQGNPLRARNVVRWLLHNPGFHTGKIHYGTRELYFRYSEDFEDFRLPGSTTSRNFLTVTHTPLDIYLGEPDIKVRSGSAYCLRKGKGRPIEHDLRDSTLIDNMSHKEVAAIFRRVQTFYCYDPNTLYANLAALSGCDSIVIPQAGIPIEQWRPTLADRAGVAYGIEDVDRARRTRDQVLERMIDRETKSLDAVRLFMRETIAHFALG